MRRLVTFPLSRWLGPRGAPAVRGCFQAVQTMHTHTHCMRTAKWVGFTPTYRGLAGLADKKRGWQESALLCQRTLLSAAKEWATAHFASVGVQHGYLPRPLYMLRGCPLTLLIAGKPKPKPSMSGASLLRHPQPSWRFGTASCHHGSFHAILLIFDHWS